MDRLRSTLPIAFITTLLLILIVTTDKIYSQQELPPDDITALEKELNIEEKNYPENLTPLVDYFNEKGVNITELLEDPRFELYNGISKRFTHSAEKKSVTFESYKVVLGFDSKKDRINQFMADNAEALEEAEKQYDISRYVISAIIGVESSFGKVEGKYNPFNAYVSMISEDYRASFAQAQLEELLIFTERNNLDVFELKSSYAGAMSFAQFIPYSLNRWFVGDNLQDMDNNIYSVANYLAHFKEITGTIEKAVYRYNPSQLYTDAVMALAKEAEKSIATTAK